jgi:hypothetical protein
VIDPFSAFYLEHRRCGELAAGRDQGAAEAVTVWISCSCGARVAERGTRSRTGGSREEEPRGELAGALDAFYLEHRRCGEFEAGLDQKGTARVIVWMSCSCGGQLARHVDPDNATRSEGGG